MASSGPDNSQWLSVTEETLFLHDGLIRVTDLVELPQDVQAGNATAAPDNGHEVVTFDSKSPAELCEKLLAVCGNQNNEYSLLLEYRLNALRGLWLAQRQLAGEEQTEQDGLNHEETLALLKKQGIWQPGEQVSFSSRVSLLLIFPLLKSQSRSDPSLCCMTAELLLQCLRDCAPLSLTKEPSDCLNGLESLLCSWLEEGEGGATREGGASRSLQDVQQRENAAAALVALACARGSLKTLLHTAHLLQRLQTTLSPLPVAELLFKLLQTEGGPGLTTSLLGSKHLLCWGFEDMLTNIDKGPDDKDKDSEIGRNLACDGCFLYTTNSEGRGLSKIGSGLHGTLRGFLYARNPQLEQGWVVWGGGRLVHRPANFDGKQKVLLNILSPHTLQCVASVPAPEEYVSSAAITTLALTSDGVYFYWVWSPALLSDKNVRNPPVYMDMFRLQDQSGTIVAVPLAPRVTMQRKEGDTSKSLNEALLSRLRPYTRSTSAASLIALTGGNTTPTGGAREETSTASSCGLSLKLLRRTPIYTCGSTLVMLTAPPGSSSSSAARSLFGSGTSLSSLRVLATSLCFSTASGQYTNRCELVDAPTCSLARGASVQGLGVCYDAVNNLIWTCSGDWVDQWHNPGNQAPHHICRRLGINVDIREPPQEPVPNQAPHHVCRRLGINVDIREPPQDNLVACPEVINQLMRHVGFSCCHQLTSDLLNTVLGKILLQQPNIDTRHLGCVCDILDSAVSNQDSRLTLCVLIVLQVQLYCPYCSLVTLTRHLDCVCDILDSAVSNQDSRLTLCVLIVLQVIFKSFIFENESEEEAMLVKKTRTLVWRLLTTSPCPRIQEEAANVCSSGHTVLYPDEEEQNKLLKLLLMEGEKKCGLGKLRDLILLDLADQLTHPTPATDKAAPPVSRLKEDLVQLILKLCVRESCVLLRTCVAAEQQEFNTIVSSVPKASPCLRYIMAMLSHVMSAVVTASNDKLGGEEQTKKNKLHEMIQGAVLGLATKVLLGCQEVLEVLLDVCRSFSASGAEDRECRFQGLERVAKATVLGHLLPVLMTSLTHGNLKYLPLADALMPQLVQLVVLSSQHSKKPDALMPQLVQLVVLSSQCALLLKTQTSRPGGEEPPPTPTSDVVELIGGGKQTEEMKHDSEADAGFLFGVKIPAPWATGKSVESIHPVRDNYKFRETVQIPGARCLYLRFDPRCSSQYDYDKLMTFAGPSTSCRKVAEYGGNTLGYGSRSVLGSGWPKDLVKVDGDTVTFSFEMRSGREHNTPDRAMWGFLITVRAQEASEDVSGGLPFLTDLALGLSVLACNMLHILYRGPEVTQEEQACRHLLKSRLLQRCVWKVESGTVISPVTPPPHLEGSELTLTQTTSGTDTEKEPSSSDEGTPMDEDVSVMGAVLPRIKLSPAIMHKLRKLSGRGALQFRPSIRDVLQPDVLEETVVSVVIKHLGLFEILQQLSVSEEGTQTADFQLLCDIMAETFKKLNALERQLQALAEMEQKWQKDVEEAGQGQLHDNTPFFLNFHLQETTRKDLALLCYLKEVELNVVDLEGTIKTLKELFDKDVAVAMKDGQEKPFLLKTRLLLEKLLARAELLLHVTIETEESGPGLARSMSQHPSGMPPGSDAPLVSPHLARSLSAPSTFPDSGGVSQGRADLSSAGRWKRQRGQAVFLQELVVMWKRQRGQAVFLQELVVMWKRQRGQAVFLQELVVIWKRQRGQAVFLQELVVMWKRQRGQAVFLQELVVMWKRQRGQAVFLQELVVMWKRQRGQAVFLQELVVMWKRQRGQAVFLQELVVMWKRQRGQAVFLQELVVMWKRQRGQAVFLQELVVMWKRQRGQAVFLQELVVMWKRQRGQAVFLQELVVMWKRQRGQAVFLQELVVMWKRQRGQAVFLQELVVLWKRQRGQAVFLQELVVMFEWKRQRGQAVFLQELVVMWKRQRGQAVFLQELVVMWKRQRGQAVFLQELVVMWKRQRGQAVFLQELVVMWKRQRGQAVFLQELVVMWKRQRGQAVFLQELVEDRGKPDQPAHAVLLDQLFSFIGSSLEEHVSCSSFLSAASVRWQRGNSRKQALVHMVELLTAAARVGGATHLVSAVTSVLQHGPKVEELTCGGMVNQVREAFAETMTSVVQLASTYPVACSNSIGLLCVIPYTRAEERCLVRSGLVQLLDKLCSLSSYRDQSNTETQTMKQRVSAMAWAGFQVLSNRCVMWEDEEGAASAVEHSGLARQVSALLTNHLARATECSGDEAAGTEALQEVLSLLNNLSRSKLGKAILSQPACVSKLLSLLLDQRPSPKLVLIVLQLCRVALPLISAEDCEKIQLPCWGQDMHSCGGLREDPADPAARIASLLLAKLGDYVVPGAQTALSLASPDHTQSSAPASAAVHGGTGERERLEETEAQDGRIAVYVHKREDQSSHEVIQPLLSCDGRPFRLGSGANMEKVVRMDRDLTRSGRAEVITEDAVTAIRRAAKWAQAGLVVSTGPPVDGTGQEGGTDRKRMASSAVCREKNAELARADPVRPFISGQVANSMAGEVIGLLHGLLTAPESSTAQIWASAVERVLTHALLSLPTLLSQSDVVLSPSSSGPAISDFLTTARQVVAALCALGGFRECVKPGTMVQIAGEGMQALSAQVVSISEQQGVATVRFEGADKLTISSDTLQVPLSRIQPPKAEPLPLDQLSMTEKVIEAQKSLLAPQGGQCMPAIQGSLPTGTDGSSALMAAVRVMAEIRTRWVQQSGVLVPQVSSQGFYRPGHGGDQDQVGTVRGSSPTGGTVHAGDPGLASHRHGRELRSHGSRQGHGGDQDQVGTTVGGSSPTGQQSGVLVPQGGQCMPGIQASLPTGTDGSSALMAAVRVMAEIRTRWVQQSGVLVPQMVQGGQCMPAIQASLPTGTDGSSALMAAVRVMAEIRTRKVQQSGVLVPQGGQCMPAIQASLPTGTDGSSALMAAVRVMAEIRTRWVQQSGVLVPQIRTRWVQQSGVLVPQGGQCMPAIQASLPTGTDGSSALMAAVRVMAEIRTRWVQQSGVLVPQMVQGGGSACRRSRPRFPPAPTGAPHSWQPSGSWRRSEPVVQGGLCMPAIQASLPTGTDGSSALMAAVRVMAEIRTRWVQQSGVLVPQMVQGGQCMPAIQASLPTGTDGSSALMAAVRVMAEIRTSPTDQQSGVLVPQMVQGGLCMPAIQASLPTGTDGSSALMAAVRVMAEIRTRSCMVLATHMGDRSFAARFVENSSSVLNILRIMADEFTAGERLPAVEAQCERLRMLYRDCARPPPPPSEGPGRQPKEITWCTSRVFPPPRSCLFSHGLSGVAFLGDPSAGSGLPRGTFLYATAPVPSQAPSFYWEIEVCSFGETDDESGPIISFGFAPTAEKRDGAWTNPVGTVLFHNNGRAVHYNGSSLLQWKSARLDVTLSAGDVAGIGWERIGDAPSTQGEQVKGRVYFTYNGQRLPAVLDDVSGGMWPVIHIQKKNTRIRANFGSRPFAFAEGQHHRNAADMSADQTEEISATFGLLPFHLGEDSDSETATGGAAGEEDSPPQGPPVRIAMAPEAQPQYNSSTAVQYRLQLSYDNFLTSGPDMRAPLLVQQEDESDDEDGEEDLQQEDHYALLVKAWEQKVFPTIRRRFRNEAERKSGLEQIKGALQLGMVDIARQTVEFLYEENGGMPRDLHLPTIEDIRAEAMKFTIERVRKGMTVVIRHPQTAGVLTTGSTVLPKFAVRGMLKTFGSTGVVLDVDSHNELVQVETYLRSEGVLVRYWYPIDMLERPPQGTRKASITGVANMDTSNIQIHRQLLQCESSLVHYFCRTALLSLLSHCRPHILDRCPVPSMVETFASLSRDIDPDYMQLLSNQLLSCPSPNGSVVTTSLEESVSPQRCLVTHACAASTAFHSRDHPLREELRNAIVMAACHGEDTLIDLSDQLCACLQTAPELFAYEEFPVTETKVNTDAYFPGAAFLVVSCKTDPDVPRKDTALYKSPWARLFCYGIGHQLRKNGHVALQEVTCYPRDAAIAGTGGLTPPPLADQYPPAILPCDRVHIRVGVSPPPGYVVTVHAVPPEFALAISFIEELISVKHHVDSKAGGGLEEQAASSYDIPAGAFVHLVELLGGYVWKSDVPATLKEIMFHLLAELLRASQSRKEDGDVCLITLSPSLALLMHVNLQAELKKLYDHENKKRQRGDVIGSGEYSRFSSYFHALMEVALAVAEVTSPGGSTHPVTVATASSSSSPVTSSPSGAPYPYPAASPPSPMLGAKRKKIRARRERDRGAMGGKHGMKPQLHSESEGGVSMGSKPEEMLWFHRAVTMSLILRYLAFRDPQGETVTNDAVADACQTLTVPTAHSRLLVISGIPMHLEQSTVREAIRKACNMYGGLFRDEVFVPLQDKEDLPVPPAVPLSSLEETSAEVQQEVGPLEGGEVEVGLEEAASVGDAASAAVDLETQQLLVSTLDSDTLPAPLASPEQDSPMAEQPPEGPPPSPLGTPCIKGYAVVEIRSKSKMDDVRSALLSSRAIVGVVSYDTEELIDVTTEDMLSVSPVNLNLLSDPQGGPALGDYLKSKVLSKATPSGLTQKAQDVITEIFHSCVVSEHAFSLESPELEQLEVVHLGKEQISMQTPMNHLHAFFTNIKGPKKSFMEQVSQVLRRYGVPKPKLKESEKPWKGPKLGNGKPSGKKVAQKPSKEKLALVEVTGAKAVVQKQSPGEKKGKSKQQEKPAKPGKDHLAEEGAKRDAPEDRYLTLEGFLMFVADKTKQDARSVWKAILACGYDLHFDRCACVDTAHAVQTSKQWSLQMDCALVDYVNALCRHLAISAARLHPHELYIREAELASPAYSCLQGVPVESLRLRFALLLSLNNTLETFFLPLVDLRPCSTYPNSTAALLSRARRLMFYDTKVVVMNSILNATAQRNPSQAAPEITLDPLEIVGGEAVTAMGTQFCQAARQLSIVPSSQLCVKLASGGDPTYAFNVRFTGEEVHGTSGSFRHFLWQVCKELQGPILNLLMLCPSATANRNKGKYILRPGPLTYGEEKLLEFLGQLLAVAVRADVPLPLDLLTPFWKGLVGLPLDEDDLREADILTYNYITRLAEAETESDFWTMCADVCPAQLQEGEGGEHPLCSFTFSSVTGEDVELCAGGRNRMLSWENRVEYLSSIRALRLEELSCSNRMAPIAAGLATIVPVQILHILTPGDLELRTCGLPHVDLAFLRSHTMYQVGLMETDTHIEFFWSSLESFSQDQLRKFVKFACNQERIPCTCPCKDGGPDTAHVPPYPMKIAPPDGPGSPDSRYIRVETCMFMIKLPQYSSQETMTERLLYAINCREDPLSG
ncbi:LOW QUALITY PROTEIN: probable E3 ubiquitin-protein ligase HECTD4 [Branchiostoma lanceolatum]|uniref:LOW QUALITY PROTEIN: probable E3 ubiquitin-protein ligase HECTD4 n=1 Tax=Branchiostoma lanceolatum TaxID=7740 RepID=UPI003455D16C